MAISECIGFFKVSTVKLPQHISPAEHIDSDLALDMVKMFTQKPSYARECNTLNRICHPVSTLDS